MRKIYLNNETVYLSSHSVDHSFWLLQGRKSETGTGVKITGKTSSPAVRSGEITDSLAFITRYVWVWSAYSNIHHQSVTRGFGLGNGKNWLFHRDTVNNKLLLADVDVIYENRLGSFVVEFSDVVLLGKQQPGGELIHTKDTFEVEDLSLLIDDTIRYIPPGNSGSARKDHQSLYAGDYIECQYLFNEAYVFIPTTGEKWRAMKAAGIE